MEQPDPHSEIFDPFPKGVKIKEDLPNGIFNQRVETMRRLIDQMPLNDLGLPRYIFRTDLIPPDLYNDEVYTANERYECINAATIDLDYFDGIPSQSDGTAFWSRLFFEPADAYKAFIEYLGVVTREDDTGNLVAPLRTFTATATYTKIPENKLREYAFLYYWHHRVKAHDLFMVANFQRSKQTRAILLEDSHYKKASKLLVKMEQVMEQILGDEDRLFDLEPKDAMKMLMQLYEMQRISVGLPAHGPAQQQEQVAPGSSLEVTMRRIAQKAGEVADDKLGEEDSVESMLNDPASLNILQELIIKSHKK